MKLVKAYNSVSLVLRIVIGMVIGAALALLIPNAAVTAPGIGILGTLFVGALKAIAPLLVFVLIISALAQSKEKLGKQFGTVIMLYLVSTFLAAVIAVIASYLFPVTITLTEAASDSAPESFAAIFTGPAQQHCLQPHRLNRLRPTILGVLFWAIVLGFAFKGAVRHDQEASSPTPPRPSPRQCASSSTSPRSASWVSCSPPCPPAALPSLPSTASSCSSSSAACSLPPSSSTPS